LGPFDDVVERAKNLDQKDSGLTVKKESTPDAAVNVGGITEVVECVIGAS
jgi:hypothetical protein